MRHASHYGLNKGLQALCGVLDQHINDGSQGGVGIVTRGARYLVGFELSMGARAARQYVSNMAHFCLATQDFGVFGNQTEHFIE